MQETCLNEYLSRAAMLVPDPIHFLCENMDTFTFLRRITYPSPL